MREVWACLVEFPNYEVSTHGRVRNSRGLILQPSITNPQGYVSYHLWINGRMYNRQSHRLVAATFINSNIDGLEIDHLDDDPSNNHVSNLEIVTRKVNNQRVYNRGRRVPPSMKAVRIVETGEEFRSVSDCAYALNRQTSNISKALVHGTRTAGYHIEHIEEA